jgi:hypothetical protein
MQYAGNLSGSAPILKRYKASATGYVQGIVMIKSAANASGQMSVSTTTSIANAVGLLMDTANKAGESVTYSTTQGAEEAVYGVLVNPDAILRAQMVTGATGTSITGDTIATATSNGLTAIGGTSVASPDMDEGILWYTSGANVGKSRKITSTSSVTATVIVPFAANAVGDTYCYAGLNLGLQGCTLTTDLKSVRTDIAVSTGATFSIFELELNGRFDSYVNMTLGGNAWLQVQS